MSEKYDEFEQRMLARFPKLFSQPFGGFAIGEGWWHIIEALCHNIQSHVDWKQEQFVKYSRGTGCKQPVVEQIKEKFGGLRFYCDDCDDEVSGMIRMAEAWAAHTCEQCGNRGKSHSGGWVRTLCEFHEAEYQKRRAEYATST